MSLLSQIIKIIIAATFRACSLIVCWATALLMESPDAATWFNEAVRRCLPSPNRILRWISLLRPKQMYFNCVNWSRWPLLISYFLTVGCRAYGACIDQTRNRDPLSWLFLCVAKCGGEQLVGRKSYRAGIRKTCFCCLLSVRVFCPRSVGWYS